uniref:30S ribosomal protein S21, chloroplastic n=1 Tax=Ananas comosus var. bracteatus TaxID=296719 RepID=A0A6V7PLD5_ANACO|nr:unnamed protein product [Ananas comosus var. bracteatus]
MLRLKCSLIHSGGSKVASSTSPSRGPLPPPLLPPPLSPQRAPPPFPLSPLLLAFALLHLLLQPTRPFPCRPRAPRAGYNVQVVVGEDEPEEVLLRRFRREVSKAGVIQECKRRRFFENKQEERKRKAREAGRRNRRRRLASGPRFPSSSAADSEAASKRASDDLDDNWDLPEGNLPY